MGKYRCNTVALLSIVFALSLSACHPEIASGQDISPTSAAPIQENHTAGERLEKEPVLADADSLPRPHYQPGELVDYIAQSGDTLTVLAVRFNTSTTEIREANPIIPQNATTMPPGMPMKIPIYYLPFWGTKCQIIPDDLFVNGPSHLDFDTQAFIDTQSGWIKDYTGYAENSSRSAGELVDLVARNYLVSPQLLLALLEYRSQALSTAEPSEDAKMYPMGHPDVRYKDLYMQMVWAANLLNDGYYRWRNGRLTSFEHENGRIERPDPWQNAATVALQYFFLHLEEQESYNTSVSRMGFAATYRSLFGDPWEANKPHIPGSLEQPFFILPFEPGKVWALTGGPHTGWGTGKPWAALDFAPPSVAFGCISSNEWATAVAPGLVTRSEVGMVTLDLDGDGDERTGWVVSYLHIATQDRVPAGTYLQTGDHIGHPSCEGGHATGSHIHITRQYNGEWIEADGELAFDFEGWIAHDGNEPYQGTLSRSGQVVYANTNANDKTFVSRETP